VAGSRAGSAQDGFYYTGNEDYEFDLPLPPPPPFPRDLTSTTTISAEGFLPITTEEGTGTLGGRGRRTTPV